MGREAEGHPGCPSGWNGPSDHESFSHEFHEPRDAAFEHTGPGQGLELVPAIVAGGGQDAGARGPELLRPGATGLEAPFPVAVQVDLAAATAATEGLLPG